MRRLWKWLYALKLLRPFQEVDPMRYLRRLDGGSSRPGDRERLSARDLEQHAGGDVLVRARFREAGVWLMANRDTYVEASLISHGLFDRDTLELAAELVRPDLLVVEVGGNVGAHSLPLAAAFPLTPIHSYEPNPFAAARFRENLGLNHPSNLILLEKAVADAPGRARFHAYQGRYQGDSGFLQPPKTDDPGQLVEVETVTLDRVYLEGGERVGLIKMDVQGYEAKVLQGARGLVERDRPAILLEHEDENFAGPGEAAAAKAALEEFFRETDYRVFYATRYSPRLLFPVRWDRPLSGDLMALPRG